MDKAKVAAFVVSSGILNEYQSQDECLANLIRSVSQSPQSWQSSDSIDIGGFWVPSFRMEQIGRKRLKSVPNEIDVPREARAKVRQLRTATERLVDYCANHPNAQITAVSFHCSGQHYDVFCSRDKQQLDAICVIVGKPVPPYARKR